jgi:hypothetical protein
MGAGREAVGGRRCHGEEKENGKKEKIIFLAYSVLRMRFRGTDLRRDI